MGGESLGESVVYKLVQSALNKEKEGADLNEVVQLLKEAVEKSPESAEGRAANRNLIRLTGKSELTPKMSSKELFFSFEGRITRTTFWADLVLPIFPILLLMYFFDYITGTHYFTAIFILLFAYPILAAGAKRCHDRNRSGWYQLLGLIPLVNIWVTIDLGFIKGTKGDNKYGPDMLAINYER
jgi:uncharacterized membrane protein YhaH (DUF805 family)